MKTVQFTTTADNYFA